jgi:hypothetical protein
MAEQSENVLRSTIHFLNKKTSSGQAVYRPFLLVSDHYRHYRGISYSLHGCVIIVLSGVPKY